MSASTASHRHPSILVIESDPEGRSLLRTTLSPEEYLLNEATTGVSALRQVEVLHPDAILLDPRLPDIAGLDVIRQLRIFNPLSPIIVLSDIADQLSRVTALDAGADDFMEKPFVGTELLARLRASLRRVAHFLKDLDEPPFYAAGFSVNFVKREVRVRGQVVHLTPGEFKMLHLFTRYPNRVLTHAVLINEIWGSEGESDRSYVSSLRVCVAGLRRKLCVGPEVGVRFQTESSIGYQFKTN